jgi:glucose/arabinose dehydrogenase
MGEAENPDLAQDKGSLGGKILRMTPSGQPARDNPSGTLVWSYRHRNVQGIAWDSAGRLWASEFGDKLADELNLIEPGNNYGWPATEGRTSQAGYTSPVAQWGRTRTRRAASRMREAPCGWRRSSASGSGESP